MPFLICIKCLLNREDDESEETEIEIKESENSYLSKFFNFQTYSVAAVTFANGTDNISIYVPLFASSNWESLLIIMGVFFMLVGFLCYLAYKLTHNTAIANLLTRSGNDFMPFVLIGLGSFIIVDSGSLTLITAYFR